MNLKPLSRGRMKYVNIRQRNGEDGRGAEVKAEELEEKEKQNESKKKL